MEKLEQRFEIGTYVYINPNSNKYQEYLNRPLIILESFKDKYGGKYMFVDEPNQYLVSVQSPDQTKQETKWIYENYLIDKETYLKEYRNYKINQLIN
jgi:hypothetical protein